MILYKTLRLCNFWEPAVESILAFPFNKLWRKRKQTIFSSHLCDVSWIFKTRQLEALLHYSTHLSSSNKVSHPCFVSCRTLLKLGALLWPENIPLLVCCSYGFIGCMRIVLQEHCGNIHVLKCWCYMISYHDLVL